MATIITKEFSSSETAERSKNSTNYQVIITPIVSDEVLYYFQFVNSWGPGQGVCIFGVITNILTIITFAKQGVRDTVNISLLGLATSDLGSQITLMYANITVMPLFLAQDLPYVASDIMYFVGWCHVMFTRISTWITAYITLERCLCVTAPLKVKHLFTPKRTVLYLVAVYLMTLASACPCFFTTRAATIFDPLRNKTVLGLSFMENRDTIETVALIANNVVPTTALCLIVVCTAVLVSALRQKSKWRQNASSASNTTAMSVRDNKVVKMVVLISVIFIICYAPSTAVFIYMLIDNDIRIDGIQRTLFYALFSLLFHLESINAGVNIFIYLSMSSKFKATFENMFCCRINSVSDVRSKVKTC